MVCLRAWLPRAVPARIRSARESICPWRAPRNSRLLHLSASNEAKDPGPSDWKDLKEAPGLAVIYTNYVSLAKLRTQHLQPLWKNHVVTMEIYMATTWPLVGL